MKRRAFIALIGGAAVGWPLVARAQQPGRIYRLGFLTPSNRQTPPVLAFFDELRVNGFVEGQNLSVIPGGFEAVDDNLAEQAAAASAMNQQLEILTATTTRDMNPTFSKAAQKRADALLISPDPLFTTHPVQLATLAARYGLPAIYALREFAEVGGLMSYGSNFTDMFRQAGIYTGRILKGEKPGDLPILQATKFELIINLPTAEALGVEVPATLLALADEVIE